MVVRMDNEKPPLPVYITMSGPSPCPTVDPDAQTAGGLAPPDPNEIQIEIGHRMNAKTDDLEVSLTLSWISAATGPIDVDVTVRGHKCKIHLAPWSSGYQGLRRGVIWWTDAAPPPGQDPPA